MAGHLYRNVADRLEREVMSGVLGPGERLPSIRRLRRQLGASVSTVIHALVWLEERGLIEAKPRSGFYVRDRKVLAASEPSAIVGSRAPRWAGVNAALAEVLDAAADGRLAPLGLGGPPASILPIRTLNRLQSRVARSHPEHSATYALPTGSADLRRQIARHLFERDVSCRPEDIVITCGTMEALNLSLRAVAKPGDLVAVETPTFFGILQMLESLGMRAVEIPTHARDGPNLDALERAIRRHRVRACVVMPTCHNPLGYVMNDGAKRSLVALTAKHGVAVIEDDIYGELAFSDRRPPPLKAYDRAGLVLYCASFSKVLAPGYRVGWVMGGRFQRIVAQLKFINTIASPSLSQHVLAAFLEGAGYQRHLRRLREEFARNIAAASAASACAFPAGTRMTRPAGGCFLWLELPKSVNALSAFRAARKAGIAVVPGQVFSMAGRCGHHLRISCAAPWSADVERAVLELGRICRRLAARGAR